MKRILVILFIAFSLLAHAQIPSGYYNNANNKTGDALKEALHDIIKGHHVVSYSGLLDAFVYTDCKPNGKIWDIYSNFEFSLSGNCGSYQEEGDCWNREHTWPQSWFNESSTPRSDLFHVYPTDGFVNGQRSNYPYGEVNNPTYTSGNGSKLGPCVTQGYSGKVFEPIDEYKGDIARSYFYMSVRYYSEDSYWGTSGMTNKSEILPWAMTMLLRWSDADPVSDKEIARNNAVYGYQNNRNPFIDHPEYARMIWDPNWQGGTYYNITCATGLQHGSVSAPESAMEGSTVAITATPEPGYMVDTYTVYKTGSPSTTVTVSSNGTFTMPGYDVTVSATFVQNSTQYQITLGSVSHGSTNASTSTALSGTTVNLTATPDSGYSLYAWYVFKTGDMGTTVNVSGNSFVMPAFDVTVMATFVQGTVGGGDYVKVTSPLTDWSGEYLIVYENGSKAFNGGLTELDANNNTISVTINENGIASNATTDAARFTIAPMSGGYSIQSASGKYIGYSGSSNGLTASTTALQNTISLSNGSIIIQGTGTSTLQYNSSANRFRYYGSTQQPIQLYKKTSNTPTPTHGIHFNPNGGTGMMDDQTVTEFEPTALNANAFTRENYVFDGWNTETDGTGDYYADEATVILLEDLELYAQWNQLFSITLAEVSHGTIGCSATQAFEGDEIILTAQPDPCYVLAQWTVTDAQGNLITVTEDQFDMPASDVTVSAVFAYSSQSFVQEYQLVTSAEQLVAGRTYLIVNYANSKALGTTQNNNNRSAAEVSIEDNIISTIDNTVCELTLGASGNNWTFFDAGWGSSGGYLYAASSKENQLRTQATITNNSKWSISLGTNGIATIQAQGENTRNLLKYNNSSNIFSCYAENSNQLDVCLFRRTEISDYPAEQPVTLASGWTWWAPTVVSSTLLSQLEQALGMSGILINSQNNGFARYANGSWESSLPGLVAGQMYRIQTSAPCQFTLSGVPATGVEVSIVSGYNWFGYTGAEPLRLADLDISPAPASGDKINSQEEGFAVFNGTMWSGTLTSLQPGKGYVYISVDSQSKTLTF